MIYWQALELYFDQQAKLCYNWKNVVFLGWRV